MFRTKQNHLIRALWVLVAVLLLDCGPKSPAVESGPVREGPMKTPEQWRPPEAPIKVPDPWKSRPAPRKPKPPPPKEPEVCPLLLCWRFPRPIEKALMEFEEDRATSRLYGRPIR